jgi:hypothetical protein
MNLIPCDPSNRHTYFRCSNQGDNEYTLVRRAGTTKQQTGDQWKLMTRFERVEIVTGQTLPGWRLYEIEQ